MAVEAITQELVRAKHFGIERQSSSTVVDTPQSGDVNLFALTDGSVSIRNSSGVDQPILGASQTLAVSANGAKITMKTATASVTCSGATSTATSLIPAKAILIGVAVRVTTAITGATTFTIGDGSDADRWGTGIAIAVDTVTSESDATADPSGWSATALSVVLTATGSNFTAGVVRVTAFYHEYDGPTS